MTSYSPNLLLSEPTPGDPAVKNAWGTILNTNDGMLDAATTGVLSLSVAGSSNVILTSASGTTVGNQALNQTFIFTGALTGSITVFWPQSLARCFNVTNATTGPFALTIAVNNGSGSPAGTTFAAPAGLTSLLKSDGANITSQITNGGQLGGPTTGDVKSTFKTTADPGWILHATDGLSIGSAASGATNRANTDTGNLFILFWTNLGSSLCPLQDSAGSPATYGASGYLDFLANKRLVLPVLPGRDLGVAGQGAFLTNRPLGTVTSWTGASGSSPITAVAFLNLMIKL